MCVHITPSALRAAAKNFLRVMTVPKYSPEAYESLLEELHKFDGCTDIFNRLEGFKETFKVLAQYDSDVSKFADCVYWTQLKDIYEIIR